MKLFDVVHMELLVKGVSQKYSLDRRVFAVYSWFKSYNFLFFYEQKKIPQPHSKKLQRLSFVNAALNHK